jgi:alpha-L-rhamnosidase
MKKKLYFLLCLYAASIILPFQVHAASPNSPDNLRSFDKCHPVGTDDKPYFGWHVNDRDEGEIQTAYQILIATSNDKLSKNEGDVWDSQKTLSRAQNYVYADSMPLSPATRYYWKVRTWDKDGNVSPYSTSATFETGMLTNSDWAGVQWIRRSTRDKDEYTYFRKKFQLSDKKVERATIYISTSHSYELYVNGTLIGKGFNHHYPSYSYYQAWDITSALSTQGENVIACLTHWYGGGQGRATGAPGLLCKTVIRYKDSSPLILVSDSSWKQTQAQEWLTGQPQRNSEGVGYIETIDSRKFITDWNQTSFDDSSWKPADVIGSQPTKPWTGTLQADLSRVIEKEITPVSVVQLNKDIQVIDLGKIYSGSFKIQFSGGNAGDTVRMTGGFVLNSTGTIDVRFNQRTNLDFNFILNGSEAIFHPNVYLGLRYLEVRNAPNVLTVDNVRFINRHFELDPSRSDFHSSNSMLNRVWELMQHSMMAGTQEGFVDTPTREKGTFLGDAWSQAVPAMSVQGDRVMNLKILNEFLDSQEQYWPDGRLNAVYPNVDGRRDIPDYTQSYLIWAWDYYLQTGNKQFLLANYQRLRKIAEYVQRYRNDTTGLIHNLAGGTGGPYQFGIVDWPMTMRYGYDIEVESRTVIDSYAYLDFKIMSDIAETLGFDTDKENFNKKAEAMKAAINARLINADGVYIDGLHKNGSQSKHVSQHANVYPLAMGIVPIRNLKKVVDTVVSRRMSMGMVGLRWLPEALGQAEQGEHLLELYTNTTWDGWAKTIAKGGTMTWEAWDADTTRESLSHPWGAVGLLAIQQYMLGIKSLTPQNELIQIKPLLFGDSLNWVKGTYCTDQGDVKVEWKRNNDDFSLIIELPVNTKAHVYIPKYKTRGNILMLDGKKCKARRSGNYLLLENIGSGAHSIKNKVTDM